MHPETLGAARLTRYSFSRMMLRTAARHGWSGRRVHFEMDDTGRGEAVYEIDAEGHTLSFVAFTTVLEESAHTDRVIGEAWEITGALVDGVVGAERRSELRNNVPKQERGRFGADVIVLTRGNRSVRFFEGLISRLAAGFQPQPTAVADAGYLMRSTAFYGNGKFGTRSFEDVPSDHPLVVPYRAQMLCAWLYRELSYDVVEHCARAVGGDRAVGFDHDWRRYFGLGNATGLGLVPFAIKHPRILHTWAAIRELALADVRSLPTTPDRRRQLLWWIERTEHHFASASDEDATPFLSPRAVAALARDVRDAFQGFSGLDALDELYRWAEDQSPECCELVVSMLIELDGLDRQEERDTEVDRLLVVDEHHADVEPITVEDASHLITARFDWLDTVDAGEPAADHYWWVLSDNNEEPRRARRRQLAPKGRDLAIDVALRMHRLRRDLRTTDAARPIQDFLAEHPIHRFAVRRLIESDRRYGEARDNACAEGFLPLQLQRFQLAVYGMDNFKPKSTDWLRVTLFQGAPRLADLADSPTDDWILPTRPGAVS